MCLFHNDFEEANKFHQICYSCLEYRCAPYWNKAITDKLFHLLLSVLDI